MRSVYTSFSVSKPLCHHCQARSVKIYIFIWFQPLSSAQTSNPAFWSSHVSSLICVYFFSCQKLRNFVWERRAGVSSALRKSITWYWYLRADFCSVREEEAEEFCAFRFNIILAGFLFFGVIAHPIHDDDWFYHVSLLAYFGWMKTIRDFCGYRAETASFNWACWKNVLNDDLMCIVSLAMKSQKKRVERLQSDRKSKDK